MIASLSIRTLNRDKLEDYIDGDVTLWGVSEGIYYPGMVTKQNLMLEDDAKLMYDQLKRINRLNRDTFSMMVAPKYLYQTIHNSNAYQDLTELVRLTKSSTSQIILVGESDFESICVRSVLVGIMQGLFNFKDYTSDSDSKSDFSNFWQMLPYTLRSMLIQYGEPL